MTKPRKVETANGIQGEFNVKNYDIMQRHLRNRGWIETNEIIKSGISAGLVLELGPGPGYLGLEWLKRTEGTCLKGLDISQDMIKLANKNSQEYGLADRAEYLQGVGHAMPFKDRMFDAIFSNGSLHEWAEPLKTFSELCRVLKPGGRLFISDLRRDMNIFIKWFLWVNTKPKSIRPGLITSIAAAYTPAELRDLIETNDFKSCSVTSNPIGVVIIGEKNV